MRRFNFYLLEELFERIKLMSNFYDIPISKMRPILLEVGYINVLDNRGIK